jgi:zinc transport system ATP-binding protein
LLDEPVSGLDPNASAEMYDLIASLNKDGTTIIMISHDIASTLKYATHILHIGKETTLFSGTKDDYIKSRAGHIYAEFAESGQDGGDR